MVSGESAPPRSLWTQLVRMPLSRTGGSGVVWGSGGDCSVSQLGTPWDGEAKGPAGDQWNQGARIQQRAFVI